MVFIRSWDGHIYGIGKRMLKSLASTHTCLHLLGPLFWESKPLEQRSKLQLGTIKNGFSKSDLPPNGFEKKPRGNLSNWSKHQNRPRDHQTCIQHVRYTCSGSEKRVPRQSKQLEQKSKLQLGSPTYPKWVRKKSPEAI